jgi:hypothetical protein
LEPCRPIGTSSAFRNSDCARRHGVPGQPQHGCMPQRPGSPESSAAAASLQPRVVAPLPICGRRTERR